MGDSPPRLPNDLLRVFRRRVLLPLVAVTVTAVVLAVVGLWHLTGKADALSAEKQSRATAYTVDSAVDALVKTQEIAAVWDTAAEELSKPNPDWDWVDSNIGTWLSDMFGHDRTYVLDGEDRPIYASVEGRRVEPGHYASVAPVLAHFVDDVRGRTSEPNNPHERLPGRPLNPDASVSTKEAAVHATDLAWLQGRPAAISVMRVVPHTRANPRPGSEPLLVSVRFLDGSLLAELARSKLIAAPRFSNRLDLQEGERGFALDTKHGRVGYFIWRPELPGSALRVSLVLTASALIVVLGVLMALLARSLYRSMRDQHRAKEKLESALLELQASEAQAHHLAFHDVLTGLPNRALFHDRIEQALARASESRPVALLMLDLDRFKQVNDTFGHAAGDALIREFALRVSDLLQPSATLARLGGDEFVILIPSVNSRASVVELCESILAAAHEPFAVLGNEAYVGVSMGYVFAPDGGVDRMELMRKADIALYHAKADGRDCYRAFAPGMDESIKFRRQIEEDLRRALVSGDELRIHYQPQVAAAGGPIIGVEALVRWQHRKRGLISPESFIPVAEETGLISQLGEWILREACSAARRWPQLFVAVNLSPAQFRMPHFAERAIQIVREAGVSPAQIELEVTETVLLHDDDTITEALQRLRQEGFKIALDDFGTGYSSLSHLRKFEVDKIKIDRSFVQNLGANDSTAIVTAVVNLAHAMGLEVTAEGVETPDQSAFLTAAGCNVMQGFLFSRALPSTEIEALLDRKARDVA